MTLHETKNVLITGATGGIGEAIARLFHKEGYTVILSGTRTEKLQDLVNDLKERVHAIACCLSDYEAVESFIPECEEKFGPLAVMINNAGITRDNLAIMMKNDQWDEVIHVNLTAAFHLSKAALKAMMKRRQGRIINITSVVGYTGNPGQANYCASKAGIVGMSKAMAYEAAKRGITVNCVAPGFIETPMTEGLRDTVKEKIVGNIPMNRMGKPDDIAHACLYLASDAANYVTGETLHVNGGMAMY
jgi:3-oxoacyl-[acyl-carrier protein] reductase